jgi:hypothetical protein
MFQTKVVETTKTHLMFHNFVLKNLTFYEIMWKNVVEPDGPKIRTWLLPFASCIHKATNTHS